MTGQADLLRVDLLARLQIFNTGKRVAGKVFVPALREIACGATHAAIVGPEILAAYAG